MKPKLFENNRVKLFRSKYYNYNFNKESGLFERWGEKQEDDPMFSPYGPEILDIEVSTICNGIGKSMDTRKPCPWCYKSNTEYGENMSFETFKDIFHKFPKTLTQIAFGIGDLDGNPDLPKIMDYCRNNKYNQVVPNVTINGMGLTKEKAEWLANTCGAVSVSRYHMPDLCYDVINMLSEAGLKQVNIHQLLAEETYDSCFQLLHDAKDDPRLVDKLNAIVFLLLKPRGKRNKYHSIRNMDDFKRLFEGATKLGVSFGMDSCSSFAALKWAHETNRESVIQSVEPCESGLFSWYINTQGIAYPCSFAEGIGEWKEGIDLSKINNFMKEVWYSDRVNEWRKNLLTSSSGCASCSVKQYCRTCPIFDISACREK